MEAEAVLTGIEIGRKLDAFYSVEESTKWMDSPHPQLNGMSASDAIKAGRAEEVLAILQRLDDSVYL